MCKTIVALLSIGVVLIWLFPPPHLAIYFGYPRRDGWDNLPVPKSLQRSWGAYTPFYPIEEYQPPPDDCKVTQPNMQLQRHGARYPTRGASEGIQKAVHKLLSASEYREHTMFFLNNYKYELGTDQLIKFGADHARHTGAEMFYRYNSLINKHHLPFVRASGKQRVVDTATNWTRGFAEASRNVYQPKLDVILSEKLNDTLDNTQCPNAGDADFEVDEWVAIYGQPIAKRLNKAAPGANLTAADVYGLMLLCPFESQAKMEKSSFCDLFTQEEFGYLAYTSDLDKYYSTGYGQPLGRVQGVGYINELLARLTKTPVRDNTQTNRTLDSSPDTFPLDRTVYADFSHDNQMIAIYTAVGLFPQYRALDPTTPDDKRSWMVSRMVPFSARMVTEKVECRIKEYVRIFVNDALQPLAFCGADEEDGMCELNKFVKSQRYARHDGEGDWEACHAATSVLPVLGHGIYGA
ncbi:hypothetical protein AMATHDRAFT_148650 [Amanita thiersii Skay4041]|uniref:Phytase A n=1 Tax=Amanita thiersii Skay4041 TaxID=703135 RepID=A0A2A9NMU2_9AGAR|nr:hypothetical protein AMATHDRAFT_148650 [Amanita thiersii Skay4041]